jgi:hypothetical protein
MEMPKEIEIVLSSIEKAHADAVAQLKRINKAVPCSIQADQSIAVRNLQYALESFENELDFVRESFGS